MEASFRANPLLWLAFIVFLVGLVMSLPFSRYRSDVMAVLFGGLAILVLATLKPF